MEHALLGLAAHEWNTRTLHTHHQTSLVGYEREVSVSSVIWRRGQVHAFVGRPHVQSPLLSYFMDGALWLWQPVRGMAMCSLWTVMSRSG